MLKVKSKQVTSGGRQEPAAVAPHDVRQHRSKMDFQPKNRDDIILPSWLGKVFALIVLAVALGLIYYGVHDGIIDQDIAYRTKSGQASIAKGYIAVVMGLVFLGLGIALGRVSVLIYQSSNK